MPPWPSDLSETSPLETIYLAVVHAGPRLDQFIADSLPQFSRTEVQRLIKSADILVNKKTAKSSYRVEPGDTITITLPPPQSDEVIPEAIPLHVIYEDADLVVVNKPAGMVVHPAFGNRSDTLVNAALSRWPSMRGVGPRPERAGIVHRLDKGTSGLIVLAKTTDSLHHLQRQFKQRTVYKRYLALVEGIPESSSGLIDAPVGRDPVHRQRMAVVREGRPAVTRFDVLESFDGYALLSLEPRTGRTHQIRVHLAWLGHPVCGDRVYGRRRPAFGLDRFFLHAADLHIDSPSTGQHLEFSSPLPDELQNLLDDLRRLTIGH